MAALSAKRVTKSRRLGHKTKYLMKASTTIYAGGMVVCESGLAIPAANGANNSNVCGVAVETVTRAASGDYYSEVQEGAFLLGAASSAQANVIGTVYAKDDQTVDETAASNDPTAGRLIEFVSSTSGWVRIGPDSV